MATAIANVILPSYAPLRISILIIFLSSVLLFTLKPTIMFNHKNHFKAFGVGHKQTLFPFWLAVVMIGVFSYTLSTLSMT